MKAGVEPGDGPRPRRAARGRLDRLAALARGLRLGLRARSAPTPGCSRPAAAPTSAPRSSAACPTAAGLPRASCRRARSAPRSRPGTRTATPLDRRGRRARHHRADAVDAGLLLGRRRRRALPRELLRACTPASGATATGSRSPRAARRSSTAARTRRSTAAASAWARARSTARCSALDEIVDALVVDVPRAGHRGLDAALRRPARGRRARRRPASREIARRDPRATARRATSPTRSSQIAEVPRTLSRQGARGAGQADPHGHAGRARPPAATRSPTRRRSTTSPRWQRAWTR